MATARTASGKESRSSGVYVGSILAVVQTSRSTKPLAVFPKARSRGNLEQALVHRKRPDS